MAKLPIAVLSGLILAQAVPLQAQDSEVNFSIGDRRFSMPVPDGYCPPEGELIDLTDTAAEADTMNFTMTSLLACEGSEIAVPVERYFVVKTARATVNQSFDKAGWLPRWEAVYLEFNAQEEAAMEQQGEDSLERALGASVEVQEGARFVERDDECVYTGGTNSINSEGQNIVVQTVTCLTVRGDRAISIHFYNFTPGEHIGSMRSAARSIAMSIEAVR